MNDPDFCVLATLEEGWRANKGGGFRTNCRRVHARDGGKY
jgi:hypothetical protein